VLQCCGDQDRIFHLFTALSKHTQPWGNRKSFTTYEVFPCLVKYWNQTIAWNTWQCKPDLTKQSDCGQWICCITIELLWIDEFVVYYWILKGFV